MAKLPVWFAEPPVVGGSDTYTITEATTQAEYNQITAQGSIPQFTTQAEAEAFVKARNASFTLSGNPLKAAVQLATGNDTAAGQSQSTASDLLGTLAEFLGLANGAKISGTNLAIRAAKIIVGAAMIVVGIAKLTGTDKAITTAARTAVKGAVP